MRAANKRVAGTFTNQIQRAFKEPRLLIVVDPYQDHQAVTEASYVNIPVIAFCNSDSPLKLVDLAIPCNNKGNQSIGLMLWMLAREVLVLRGRVSRAERGTYFLLDGKVIMPDLYFYRDQEDEEAKADGDGAAQAKDDEGGAHTEWGHEGNAEVGSTTLKMTLQDLGVTGAAAMGLHHPVGGAGGLADFASMPHQPMDWAAEAAATQQWTATAPGAGQPQQAGGQDDQWGGAASQW